MDLQAAVDYIEEHGSPLERERLAAMISGAPASGSVLAPLLELQREDGSWPLRLDAGLPGSLNSTCVVLGWLAELDELDQQAVDRACDWIAAQQNKRGIWREPQTLLAYDPPPWADPDAEAAYVYTTALCASTLATTSQRHMLEVDKAVQWLQTQVGKDGLLPGFRLHSTWLALPAMAEILTQRSKTVRRMVAGLGDHLSGEWEASMVAWMLNALLDAGYRDNTAVVIRALTRLEQRQRPDGSWAAEDADSEVQATLMALRAARRLGRR